MAVSAGSTVGWADSTAELDLAALDGDGEGRERSAILLQVERRTDG